MNNLENEVGEIVARIFNSPVQPISRIEATQAILNLIEQQVLSGRIDELEKAHRAGGTRTGDDPHYDNDTDEYIDDRVEELKSLKERG